MTLDSLSSRTLISPLGRSSPLTLSLSLVAILVTAEQLSPPKHLPIYAFEWGVCFLSKEIPYLLYGREEMTFLCDNENLVSGMINSLLFRFRRITQPIFNYLR